MFSVFLVSVLVLTQRKCNLHVLIPDKNIKPVDNSVDLAQKKFGSAKAISSDQFFDNRSNDYDHQTTLNRFQGSSSISSAELFGNGQGKLCFAIINLYFVYVTFSMFFL